MKKQTQYIIQEGRHYYGKTRREWFTVIDNDFPTPLFFGDRAAAQAEIKKREESVYYLTHNEYARADYRCVKVDDPAAFATLFRTGRVK